MIHILHHGSALCGMRGVPAEWPAGHAWLSLEYWLECQQADSGRFALATLAVVTPFCGVCDARARAVDESLDVIRAGVARSLGIPTKH